MRNFKMAFFFCILVMSIGLLLNFILVPSSHIRVLLHEVQDESINYDLIVVGQSHGETDINPMILEEKTGLVSYNLSRRLLSMEDMEYMVKESNYKNDVKVLVMDIDPTYWIGDTYTNYFSDSYIYRHLNNPRNKMEYFFDKAVNRDFRITLCPYTDIKTGLLELPTTIKNKLSREYWDYSIEAVEMPNDNFIYMGRGFRSGINKTNASYIPMIWDETQISETALQSFINIVDYCNRNEIQLICISSPLPAKRIEEENYDEAHEYFSQLMEQYQVTFFDFNCVKEQFLQISEDSFMDEDGHMMGIFAEEYSNLLGEILKKSIAGENVDEYFRQ